MNDTLQTLIRAGLKVGAGYLLAKGLTDSNGAETLISSVTGIIAVVWGVFHRTPAKPATN
jgi:hypothetical protein